LDGFARYEPVTEPGFGRGRAVGTARRRSPTTPNTRSANCPHGRVDFVWDGTTLAEQITSQRSITWDYDPASQVERSNLPTRDSRQTTDERF
jgi:hypothetical protein